MLIVDGTDSAPALLLETEAVIEITGPIARVTVRQRFQNPGESWAEGLYVFPLPDDAAVDHLRMYTKDRIVEGQIREREVAKREYEAAKAAGKRSSLVQQQRPNVFTTRLANLGPGESITIEIEYQQTVRRDGDVHRLRFPMTVTPRFDTGDPHLIGPVVSVVAPPAARVSRQVEISIDLVPGFPVERIESPYHAITTEDVGGRYLIELADGRVPADRDFVLSWRAVNGRTPAVSIFSERRGEYDYALLMLSPPEPGSGTAVGAAREVIFVLDTSGSMAGASIRQAKSALWLAAQRLKPEDRFNIVRFSDSTSSLFPIARSANRSNLEDARVFINRLKADGGTRMLPALRRALSEPVSSGHRVRQVVFLTDGAVGNEDTLLREIHANLGDARLFPIGIGSAPNTHLMRKIASFGRGTFTHIGSSAEIEEVMQGLFRKLERVRMSEIEVELSDGFAADILPKRIPDVYAGEPVVVSMRAPRLSGEVRVSGYLGGEYWEETIVFRDQEPRAGVSGLWARRSVSHWMDEHRLARSPERRDAQRARIVRVGLEHHLVTAFTSLVAVERSVVRRDSEPLDGQLVPSLLPDGWKHGKMIAVARTATTAPAFLLAGGLALLLGGILLCVTLRREVA